MTHPFGIVRSNNNNINNKQKGKVMVGMKLDEVETAFLFYDLENNTWVAYETLPPNYSLTAGEDENTHAFVDISHWTDADLDEFDKSEELQRLTIIESLEFTEFSKQMREHGSGTGIVFGMGGSK